MQRIEKKAMAAAPCPRTGSLGLQHHPCWHFSDSEHKPWARTKTRDNKTYVLLSSGVLGGYDLFLMRTDGTGDTATWTRPMLVPSKTLRELPTRSTWMGRDIRGAATRDALFDPSATKPKPGALVLTVIQNDSQSPERQIELDIQEVLRDSDGDGWTDAEEFRLGLDPNNPDTDGDGVKDNADICPNYAPSRDDRGSDEVAVIQLAVFAAFGLSDSHTVLLVPAKSRKVQLWGYPGPVIYLPVDPREDWRWMQERGFDGSILVSWTVKIEGDKARVAIEDYEGPLAASGQVVLLEKKAGRWFVVGWGSEWIS